MAQPVPYREQFWAGPAVPVQSIKTSPGMTSSEDVTTPVRRPEDLIIPVILACSLNSTPCLRSAALTAGSIRVTSYNMAWRCPGKSTRRWAAAFSISPKNSTAPIARASSMAVSRPLLRMIPPTRPVPKSISVFSRITTFAPAYAAALAAAHPAQPPPTTTTDINSPPSKHYMKEGC